MSSSERPYPTREETFAAFAERVSRGKVDLFRSYGLDLVIGRREGVWLYDAYGERRWIDCHTNGGVYNLGHRHPAVVDAVVGALGELDIGNHHLVSGHRARLAEALARSTGDRLPRVVFAISGGEAVELAIKAARAATGRARVVSVRGGYHGHTGFALAAGDAQYIEPFGARLPEFVQIPFDDLDALDAAVDARCAAVLLEPIPATLGMPIARPGYLRAVEELCRARGARLLLDEVQTGLGRTGRTWCFQHDDLRPDAVVTGKGLSGGVYPIAAALMTGEMHAVFAAHPFAHVSTFGGAEPGCAAAAAVLEITTAPAFLARVEALGRRIETELAGLPFTVRRRGLMMGLATPAAEGGKLAAKLLYDAGIFAVYANNDPSVVQLLPPLVTSDAEADRIVAGVREAFA